MALFPASNPLALFSKRQAGDGITIVERPDHQVSVAMVFQALTTHPHLLPEILEAPELPAETRQMAEAGQTFSLG